MKLENLKTRSTIYFILFLISWPRGTQMGGASIKQQLADSDLTLSTIEPCPYLFSNASKFSIVLLFLSRYCEDSPFSLLPVEVFKIIFQILHSYGGFLLKSSVELYFHDFEEKFKNEKDFIFLQSAWKSLKKRYELQDLRKVRDLSLPLFQTFCQLNFEFRRWSDEIFDLETIKKSQKNISPFPKFWQEESLNRMIDLFYICIDMEMKIDRLKSSLQKSIYDKEKTVVNILFSHSLNAFDIRDETQKKYVKKIQRKNSPHSIILSLFLY